MRRLIHCVVLSAGWLALAAGPPSACLWDRELVGHEKQFKSNYIEPSYEPSSDGPIARGPGGGTGLLAGGAGLLMLLSGMVVGTVRGRARSQVPTSQDRPNEERP